MYAPEENLPEKTLPVWPASCSLNSLSNSKATSSGKWEWSHRLSGANRCFSTFELLIQKLHQVHCSRPRCWMQRHNFAIAIILFVEKLRKKTLLQYSFEKLFLGWKTFYSYIAVSFSLLTRLTQVLGSLDCSLISWRVACRV